jgi:site-specific recombinase XerD
VLALPTTQTLADDIAEFLAELEREEVAEKTVAAYRPDLAGFARWFEATTG